MAGRKNRFKIQVFFRFLVAISFLGASTAASGQSAAPSRVTPQSFAPSASRAVGAINIPALEPGTAPRGAERLSVRLADIVVEGGSPEFRAEIDAAVAKGKSRRVTVKALFDIASEIEAAYARAGFVLTRITLPPQRLVDGGKLRIVVLDGFIEAVDTSRLPERQRQVIADRTASLVGARGLRMADIERRLLVAGDVPGVTLRSALVRGSQTGGARLVLDGEWRPVSVSVGTDNRVSWSYRNIEFPMQVSLNSVFGFGELIYGSMVTGPDIDKTIGDEPNRRVLGIGAIMPLGVEGWTLNTEYTRSDTNPRRSSALAIRTQGVFERFAVRSTYALVKTRTETLNVTGSFDVLNEKQSAPDFGTILNMDRLRQVTFGLEGSKSFSWNGTVGAHATVTQGLTGLGARTQADAAASGIPLSRLGSRPDFSKIDTHLRYDQSLPGEFSFAAILRAQQTWSGALPSAAQFALDGMDGLSSFPLGALSVDRGVTGRSEVARAFRMSGDTYAAIVSPYVFGAIGAGSIVQPTALELPDVRANSFGGGIRVNIVERVFGTTTVLQVELGRAHANTLARDDTRLTFGATVRY